MLCIHRGVFSLNCWSTACQDSPTAMTFDLDCGVQVDTPWPVDNGPDTDDEVSQLLLAYRDNCLCRFRRRLSNALEAAEPFKTSGTLFPRTHLESFQNSLS